MRFWTRIREKIGASQQAAASRAVALKLGLQILLAFPFGTVAARYGISPS
jgi:hypothetical protein